MQSLLAGLGITLQELNTVQNGVTLKALYLKTKHASLLHRQNTCLFALDKIMLLPQGTERETLLKLAAVTLPPEDCATLFQSNTLQTVAKFYKAQLPGIVKNWNLNTPATESAVKQFLAEICHAYNVKTPSLVFCAIKDDNGDYDDKTQMIRIDPYKQHSNPSKLMRTNSHEFGHHLQFTLLHHLPEIQKSIEIKHKLDLLKLHCKKCGYPLTSFEESLTWVIYFQNYIEQHTRQIHDKHAVLLKNTAHERKIADLE